MTTKLSFLIWLLSIIVFLIAVSPASYSGQADQPYSDLSTGIIVTAMLVGTVSFLVFIFSMIGPTANVFSDFHSKVKNLSSKISKKMVITFSIVLAIFLLIYWFQLRPSQIKSDCALETREKNLEKKGSWTMKQYDFYYKFCLHRNGL